jgi:hypothetical protein
VKPIGKEGKVLSSRYYTLADFEASIAFVREGSVKLMPLIGLVLLFQRFSGIKDVE